MNSKIVLIVASACFGAWQDTPPESAGLVETAVEAVETDLKVYLKYDRDSDGYTMPLNVGVGPADVLLDTGSANLLVGGSDCQGCRHKPYSPRRPCAVTNTIPCSGGRYYCDGALGDSFTVDYGDNTSADAVQVCDVVSLESQNEFQYTFGKMTRSDDVVAILGLGYQADAEPAELPLCPLVDCLTRQYGRDNLFELRLCRFEWPSYIRFGKTEYPEAEYDFFSVQKSGPKDKPIYKDYRIKVDALIGVEGSNETNLGKFVDSVTNAPYAALIDSGTNDMYLPDAMFKKVTNYLVQAAQKLRLPAPYAQGRNWLITLEDAASIETFPVLRVTAGSAQLDIPPQSYWGPSALTSRGNWSFTLRIQPLATECDPNDSDCDRVVIFGLPFMQNFNIVFDRSVEPNRIGFRQFNDSDLLACSVAPR